MYHAPLRPALLLDRPLPARAGLVLDDPLPAPRAPRLLDRRVAPGTLVGALVGFLGLDMLLLWRFLDFAPAWAYLPGVAVVATLAIACARAMRPWAAAGPTLRLLVTCLALCLALFMLGGEGRLFYANSDWQVRDAVMRDMVVHPWPYAYLARGLPELLRAPLGLYLVPALAGKLGGQAASDWTLLAQNSLLLTLLMGLMAGLFVDTRQRVVALVTFVAFSGMDVLGALLTRAPRGVGLPPYLEWWAGMQYSAHVTQIFWVPHHALAGWICAAGFMLWRVGRMPLAVFLTLVPLTLLWSPLAPMGALPFAALAGIETLARRRLAWRDVALPGLASLFAVPVLLYLGAAGDSVGGQVVLPDPVLYWMFQLMEVIPFLFVAATARTGRRFGYPALALVALCLLLMPCYVIGWSADFMMRASGVPLAILSLMMAEVLIEEPRAGRRAVLLAILAIGSVTGVIQIVQAVTWPAAPVPRCSFYGAWGPSPPSAKSTYLAAVERLPAPIRPHAVTLVPDRDPRRCWAGPWPLPGRTGQ